MPAHRLGRLNDLSPQRLVTDSPGYIATLVSARVEKNISCNNIAEAKRQDMMGDYEEDEEDIDLADVVGAIAIAIAIGAAAGAILALLSRTGRR